MTNNMIILAEQIRLAEEGVLDYTGREVEVVDSAGNVSVIKEIEQIHTYAHWKKLGYAVKKGEKAVAKFAIWKYTQRKTDAEEENENDNHYCFLKNSAWFSEKQVELITD